MWLLKIIFKWGLTLFYERGKKYPKAHTVHVLAFFSCALLSSSFSWKCASAASVLMLLNLASSSVILSKLKVPGQETCSFGGTP